MVSMLPATTYFRHAQSNQVPRGLELPHVEGDMPFSLPSRKCTILLPVEFQLFSGHRPRIPILY